MHVWNVLHAARWKYRMQKWPQKIAICAPSRNFVGIYIFAMKACIDNRKKLVKQQYLFHMCSLYGELRRTNGWDRFGSLGHLSIFQGVFLFLASLLQRRHSTEVNQTLHDIRPSPGLLHYNVYIHFRGLLPLTEFCQVQNSLCVQVLRSSIFAALLHGTRAAGVSQNLRCGTRNRITELSQRTPPIFGWAAIALGIGQYSSFFIGWLVGSGLKFLDNESQPSLSGSPQNFHASLMWCKALEPTFKKIFAPPLKNLVWKTLKFLQPSADPPSIGSA